MHNRGEQNIDSGQSLEAYMSGSGQIHGEYTKTSPQHLRNQEFLVQISQLNGKLQDFSHERIGDLTNPNSRQIDKTLRLVDFMISEQSKWREMKKNWSAKMREMEKANDSLKVSVEKLEKDKRFLENEKDMLVNRKKQIEKRSQDQLQKLFSQKQQLNKKLRQFQTREKGIEIQFRKKDKQVKTLRETLQKYQEKVQFKNNFEVIHKISQFGPSIYATNGEHEYNGMTVKNMEENLDKLSKQNQYLKDCLKNIYRQLNSVLELKKQTLKRRRGNYDSDFENSFELLNFRPESLCLPEHFNTEGLQNLNQNLQKFKQALKYGDGNESRVENKKDECIKGVKQILRNYKDVVHSQDQLLNKVMLRAKQFKSSEMMQMENRFSKVMDNNELERAKRFIRDQEDYLVSKNSELEKTRRAMHQTMKKVQDNKTQMMRKKRQFEEEAMNLRKQIQVIPAMIEQELQK